MVHDVDQFFKDYQSFSNFCSKFKTFEFILISGYLNLKSIVVKATHP